MVALVILALSLGILLQLLSRNLQSAGESEAYTRAVMLARMKMEESLVRETPVPAVMEGALEDGYAWSARWRPVEGTADAGRLVPFELEVTVQWGRMGHPKTLRLSTIKLFSSPEPQP
jgi:general secretion pathway protein I